jgi:hypothetical protein
MKSQENEQERASDQAMAQFESIREMVEELESAMEARDEDASSLALELVVEKAEQRIREDALSVEVRSDWHSPGAESEDTEFTILLCTGGPAVRIIGELNQWQEPESARIEYQDWFTKWTEMPLTSDEERIVLVYCSCFYFGG